MVIVSQIAIAMPVEIPFIPAVSKYASLCLFVVLSRVRCVRWKSKRRESSVGLTSGTHLCTSHVRGFNTWHASCWRLGRNNYSGDGETWDRPSTIFMIALIGRKHTYRKELLLWSKCFDDISSPIQRDLGCITDIATTVAPVI